MIAIDSGIHRKPPMTPQKNNFSRILAPLVGLALASTCAHAAVIVTPDSAIATPPALSGRPIGETINNEGLDTSAANIEGWYHNLNTANSGEYYIGDRGTTDPANFNTVFTFTFNSAVSVDTVHFWTYDRLGDSYGREIRNFDISFSTDGATFSTPISLTNWLDRNDARINVGTVDAPISKIGHQSQSFALQTGVTDIRFSNVETWVAGSRYVGFSEVKFSAVPEPTTALLGGLGMLFLLRRRR